jgi:heterogeneous nuclear ribonucleoprotein F/H
VFNKSKSEYDRELGEYGADSMIGKLSNEGVVRLRGLSFDATKADVRKFFGDDLKISSDENILMTIDQLGRPSGECYIRFDNVSDTDAAVQKHCQYLGDR